MLASLLLSKCMCASSSGSTSDDDVFSVVLSSLTLSPFTALGPAAMAFGNSALIVLIFVGHVSVAVVVTRRNSSEADNSSQMTTGTEPKQNRWKSTKNSVGAYIVQRWVALCTSPQAIALRFPNLSVGGAMFLVPGLVRGFVVVFGDMNSTPLETIGAFLSTVVLLFYTSVILEWLIYRNLILLGLQEIDSNGFATSAPLHFEPYDSRHPFTPPVPKWLASVAFSRDGRWMPADKRNSFGKLVSPLKPSFAHWWLAIPLLNIFTTLLSSLPTTSTLGCDALQGIITTASAAMSVALVAVRPHRALIVSIVAAASLIVVAVTSALGLACRHGLVSLDELLSVCSALSYVALVGKVYVALLPNLESHILQLSANVASVVPSSPKTFRKRHIGKKATPVIARDASFASNLNSSGQKQRHHKTTRQQQCTVLKQLVEAICVKRRSYAIEDILLRKS
ncbi:GP46-like surface antigen, putative [Bodo saltans]|uniref:GP46-like surface antigen, putative n=1 Tax=Bodo saltans TaxID=75058 RepID=A0A0S4JAU0_BODSA|nr:GP46-like surface antigen, putative [Bodo saltans]|eukprot:CUG86536.1 GP46-like surface antigen, putative [Bodo saltans]